MAYSSKHSHDHNNQNANNAASVAQFATMPASFTNSCPVLVESYCFRNQLL